MDIKRNIKAAAQLLDIKKLRKHQVKPIHSILNDQDTIVLARPSAGKSIIYQIPAIMNADQRTIVIEPTLSLMYDQVRKLNDKGIPACAVDSTMKRSEQSKALKRFINGKVHILYVTPERFVAESFYEILQMVPLYMVVVDECHCVLDWGYSFRQDYLRIGEVADHLPNRPVLAAFTATATQSDMQEIAAVLHMNDPAVYRNDLQCSNLTYIKKRTIDREQKRKLLCKYLRKYHKNSSVIYCNTHKAVDAVYEHLKKKFPDEVTRSHAGFSSAKRVKNEQAFLSGDKSIMVATTAFGMGIDLGAIDLVIHFNMPLSLTDYMQQTGREGRDGQKAHCVLLYDDEDYHINQAILSDSGSKRARKQLDCMKEFCDDTKHCMSQLLLAHFGQTMKKNCNHCTICQKSRRNNT